MFISLFGRKEEALLFSMAGVFYLAGIILGNLILCCNSEGSLSNFTIGVFIHHIGNSSVSDRLHPFIERIERQYTKSVATLKVEESLENLTRAVQRYMHITKQEPNNTTQLHITLSDCHLDRLLTSLSTTPRIAVTPTNCNVKLGANAPVLHINPGSHLLFEALEAILDQEPIALADLVIFFYDNSVVSGEASRFAEWLSRGKHAKALAIYGLDGRSSDPETTQWVIRQQVHFIKVYIDKTGINIYAYMLVMYSEENLRILLKWVTDFNMNMERFMWLAVGTGVRPSNFDLRRWNKENLVLLTADVHSSSHAGRNCLFSRGLMADARQNSFTNEEFYLLEAISVAFELIGSLEDKCKNVKSYKGISDLLRQNRFDGILYGVQYGRDGLNNMSIFELYRTKEFDRKIHEHMVNRTKFVNIGAWSKTSGLNITSDSVFSNRFKEFGGQMLNISMIEVHPFVIKKRNSGTQENVTYTGFCIDLLEEMKSRLNFSYRIVVPEDEVVGVEVSANIWNGEMGLILERKAHMIAGPITITMERSAVVDFTSVFMEGDSSILMKKPKGDASPLEKIFDPFHFMVWVYSIVFIVTFGLCLVIINLAIPVATAANLAQDSPLGVRSKEDEYKGCRGKGKLSRESFWFVYTNILGQSATTYPISTSARALVVIIWLFTILISAYYTANLAAILTAPRPIPHIETITEFAEQSVIKPLIKNSTALTKLFNDSQPPSVYDKIWQSLQQSIPFPRINDKALEMVNATGDYGFMGDTAQLKYIMQSECDTFVIAKEPFFKGGLAFVVPKDSVYREAVSATISKMQEAGLIERLRQKWWPSDGCSTSTQSDSISTHLSALSGAFAICGTCSAVALLVFSIECIGYRICQKRAIKKSLSIKNNFTKESSSGSVNNIDTGIVNSSKL